MEYFNLSESDSWKIHMLFSPRVVPIWLTKEQIVFCLILHDKVYPEGKGSLDGRLVELWFAIKSKNAVTSDRFINYLSMIFKDKMSITTMIKREMAFVEAFLNYLKNLPQWQQNEALRRFWNNGELPDDFKWQ